VIVDPSGLVTSSQLEKFYLQLDRLQSSGDWEPELSVGPDMNITYLDTEAKYQRIGNRVFVQAVINFTAQWSGGNTLLYGLDIGSLPFEFIDNPTQTPATGNWQIVPVAAPGGIKGNGPINYRDAATTYIPFMGITSSILNGGSQGGQWQIILGFTYFTNDDYNVSPEDAPSILFQIDTMLTSVENAITNMEQKAANGDFNGDPGPQGIQGPPGSEPILQSIVSMTDGNVVLMPDRSLYAHNPTQNTNYTFDVSGMGNMADKCITFELHISMPDPCVVIELPNNIAWLDEPDMSNGDTNYCLTFRSMDGGASWQGNLAYSYGGAA